MPEKIKLSTARVGLVCLVLALGCLSHSAMLPASFKTLDDESSIINNADIKDLANAGKIFRSSFFGSGHYYRPMVSATYMLEYHFFGLRPFYYNLDNLTLHLATAVTVFFLVFLILKDHGTAFLTSLLFAVHPLQWEAVANIPGRAVLLSTFFTVNALFCFCLFLDKRVSPAAACLPGGWVDRQGPANYVYYGLSLALFTGGLLSKESAAMLPVLIVSYIYFVRERPKPWRLALPYFGLILVYVALRRWLGITETYPWRSPAELALGSLTFLRACLTFLRLFVLPVDLHFDRAQRLFLSPGDPQLWATVTVVLAAVTLVARRRGRITGAVAFFLSWFCIELIPVSQLITTIGVAPGFISAAEHLLYMPAVGIFALMAIGGQRLYRLAVEKNICSPVVLRFALWGAVLALMLTTARQGYHARRAPDMYRETLRYNPDNARILYSMGLEMVKEQRYGEAEQYFRRTLANDPQHAAARHALGRALHDQGKYIQALAVYQAVRDTGGGDALLEKNLQAVYPLAIDAYARRLAGEPGNARLHYSLGTVYSRAGETLKGVEQYLQAVALMPDFKDALFNLATSYEALGQTDLAVTFYERMLALGGKEGHLDAHACAHLAELYRAKGDEAKAEAYMRRAQEMEKQ